MDRGLIGWNGALAQQPVEMAFEQEPGNVPIPSRNTAEMIAPYPDQRIRIAKFVNDQLAKVRFFHMILIH